MSKIARGRSLNGFLCSLVVGATFISPAEAASFSFTKIVDNTDFVEIGFLNRPSINDSGTVAFGISFSLEGGIYTGDGNSITAIATNNEFEFNSTEASPSINNNGNVAFWGFLPGFTDQSISIGNGTFLKTIADTNDFADFSLEAYSLSINDLDTVAFTADRGVYTSNGDGFTLIAKGNDGFFVDLPFFSSSNISINNSGSVAFTATNFVTGTQGIFVGDGGPLQTIATNDGLFASFGSGNFGYFDTSVTINDIGNVAFSALLDTNETGIFLSNGTEIDTIADTSGRFDFFSDSSLNNQNQIAFLANLDDGGQGIFLGSDPVKDKVIATGDSLFGSTVTSLDFYSEGLNNEGQIVFTAFLEDGRIAIVRTDPVPEPATILGTLALGLLGTKYLKRRTAKK